MPRRGPARAELTEFTPFNLAQTLVGAVFGLLVALVGGIAFGGQRIGDRRHTGFAAGFCEPLALGIVTS